MRVSNNFNSVISKSINLFVCPHCGGKLRFKNNCFKCVSSGIKFSIDSEIPLLFWEDGCDSKKDITLLVKKFYEKNPFPNYDDLDSKWSLIRRAQKGIFAKLLDEQIQPKARILEVGCGTGQLSNFLGIKSDRTVFAADICLNSLRMASMISKQSRL